MLSSVLSVVSRFSEWSLLQWSGVLLIGVVSAMIIEQAMYHIKRGKLPGPLYTVPFLGGILHMIRAPYDFWHGQMSLGPLSWNAIIGQYFIMVTEADAARRILESVSDRMPLILHPNATLLLGADNIAFLNGAEHKDLKASLLPLFTLRALSTYLSIQERHIRDSLTRWCDASKQSSTGELEMRPLIYDLNTHTSMSVFVGPYLTDDARKQFQQDYTTLTNGILAFPLYFPGTTVWYAKRAVDRIVSSLTVIAAQSKARMSSSGATPECLLDFWMVNLLPQIQSAAANNEPAPAHSSDLEVAKLVLDFLFASQDASTSSLTFTVHLLNEHPEVLASIRAEQAALRPDPSAPFTPEQLSSMKYTWQVMKEVLRFRPPATILPHIAKQPYRVNDQYTAPAGTLIIPSLWSSNRSGFSSPDTFDPDRFSPERAEHIKYDKQFLTFGCGPHVCMGQRYAMNHIMLFISLLATQCDMQRKQTKNMHDIIYLPTIYPADGVVLQSLRLKA